MHVDPNNPESIKRAQCALMTTRAAIGRCLRRVDVAIATMPIEEDFMDGLEVPPEVRADLLKDPSGPDSPAITDLDLEPAEAAEAAEPAISAGSENQLPSTPPKKGRPPKKPRNNDKTKSGRAKAAGTKDKTKATRSKQTKSKTPPSKPKETKAKTRFYLTVNSEETASKKMHSVPYLKCSL